MLIDAPTTLLNTIMHNKHLSHLMAKGMNELAHKSPLISFVNDIVMTVTLLAVLLNGTFNGCLCNVVFSEGIH